MEEQIQFNRQKFKDVVHYIVHHVTAKYGPASLGNTKLHKVLYFSDMLRYLASGTPLTGADYQRQRFGPTARLLTACLKELEREGRVRTEHHGRCRRLRRGTRGDRPAHCRMGLPCHPGQLRAAARNRGRGLCLQFRGGHRMRRARQGAGIPLPMRE